jgi:hypothetical protein
LIIIQLIIQIKRKHPIKTVQLNSKYVLLFNSNLGIDQNSSYDEDECNDSYLHPLLRGGTNNDHTNSTKKSEEILRTPSVPMNIHNTAYGQLIKKYEHLRQREK